jgi:hypothetical protein
MASGWRIATGVNVVSGGTRSMFKTSSLSDFINGCSGCLAVVITTSETSALASDANPIFTATIAPRLIKQIRASQTVLIIKGPHGIGRLGRNIWCCEPTQTKSHQRNKKVARRGHKIGPRTICGLALELALFTSADLSIDCAPAFDVPNELSLRVGKIPPHLGVRGYRDKAGAWSPSAPPRRRKQGAIEIRAT